jgi:signal transduction histidine kinase
MTCDPRGQALNLYQDRISKVPEIFDALYAAGHKPFDLAIERLVAILRVVLAFVCLVDFAKSPGPEHFDRPLFGLILVAYAVFGIIVAWLPTMGRLRTGWQLPVHLIDIGVVSALMYSLQRESNAFFIVLYVFILMSATFRWNSRGAILTTALVFGLQILFLLTHDIVTNDFIIQSTFLLIIGGMFAFFGVGRERSAERLNQIAAWPTIKAQSYIQTDNPWLNTSLAHIANVLEVPRILVVWELTQEPYTFTTLFADGKCEQERRPADHVGNVVSTELEGSTFASDSVESKEYFILSGPKHSTDQIIDMALQTKFKISSVCSTPFAGENCKGRLFFLDRSNWGHDDLVLAEVAASRLRLEIEHYAVCVRLEETAASRERIRLMRDLHDGSLQSLAAAALQLKTIASQSEGRTQDQIDSVRRLILDEQRRIRAFVDGRAAALPREPVALREILQHEIEKIRQQWGCRLIVKSLTPQEATVPRDIVHQIEFLLAEAVANAVQHGNASKVILTIERASDQLHLRIADNGHGLPGTLGTYSQSELLNLDIGPQSISKRIAELRGKLSLSSSRYGVELIIELPAIGEAAGAVSDKAHALG